MQRLHHQISQSQHIFPLCIKINQYLDQDPHQFISQKALQSGHYEPTVYPGPRPEPAPGPGPGSGINKLSKLDEEPADWLVWSAGGACTHGVDDGGVYVLSCCVFVPAGFELKTCPYNGKNRSKGDGSGPIQCCTSCGAARRPHLSVVSFC